MNFSNRTIRNMTLAVVAASVVFLTASPVTLAQDGGNRTAGETLDDTTINTSVKANLTDNDEVHARNINLETHRGRVALIGYVRSKEQHESAIATAKNTNGVVEVIDALLIVKEKRSAGRTLDDQTIESKLKYSLTETGADQALAIVTEVRNGEVLLGGFVESEEVRKRAGEIAENVPGVTKVHNRLAVK